MPLYALRNIYMKHNAYVYHVCLKLDILYNCLTALQVAYKMQCTHLSNKEERKTCQGMLEKGLDGEVSDFDIKRFCMGNPLCCYYSRTSSKHTKSLEKTTLQEKIGNMFTVVSRSV